MASGLFTELRKLEFAMGWTTCLFLSCLLLIGQVQESRQLVIKSINVLPYVQEGANDHVILDCDYDMGNSSTDGLVVKWTHNDTLVYKWHAGRQPEAVETATHIEVGYKASSDPFKMYRAMKFKNPNISLTGNYTCDVFNFVDEQIASAPMIVYSTEEKFELVYSKRLIDGDDGVEVFCLAEGLYPEPEMDISIDNISLNKGKKAEVEKRADGKYDIRRRISLRDGDLTPPALIKCTLSIPDAKYHIPREFVYYPGKPTTTPSSTTKLLRTMAEIQAFDSNEPDTDNGGGSTASIASCSLILMTASLFALRTIHG
ncbi:uncharacterized protein [Venturia canescens]|uniref:uncharacterized protein isoform X2 n=1 Tax=Venturia canescens TaxID=32260 RepID=UPI001C9D0A4C|nr:uncharacterized protein LOC122413500 isoform X2 [Venturia canescens]XP_043279822.1 uncharacterized protein LOC122413500 isoform X2 [Venturia canescens]